MSFTTLPANNSALIASALLDSQDSLVEASVQYRKRTGDLAEQSGDLRLKLADSVHDSIMQDAKKQEIQGWMSVAGGGLNIALGGGQMYTDYNARKAIPGLEQTKMQNDAIAEGLRNAEAAPTVSASDPNFDPNQIKYELSAGVDQKDVNTALTNLKTGSKVATNFKPNSTEFTDTTKDAFAQLKASSDRVADKTELNSYNTAINRHEGNSQTANGNINAIHAQAQTRGMYFGLGRELVNSGVQGGRDIVGGAHDAEKAGIDKAKTLQELTNQQVLEDRRQNKESADRYEGSVSKTLDLLKQVQANNRYNG